MLDGGFDVDIDAVNRNLDEAEVIALFFPLLRKTLLFDSRVDDTACPLLMVVEMVLEVVVTDDIATSGSVIRVPCDVGSHGRAERHRR